MKWIVALILLALLLAGCAGQETTPTTTPSDPAISGSYAGLGTKMPEITVTTAAGQTVKLSELLKEKELVLLNFWFEDCPWCIREFPVLELAYQKYRENVEIVALNPVDSAQTVETFQKDHGLSFVMAASPRSWARECGVSAYPTSIFIDRNGVVCLVHEGAITASYAWEGLFAAFTGDDYRQKIYTDVSEILG